MSAHQAERRRHKRYAVDCPVHLADEAGHEIARGRGINLSDGGMLLPVPAEASPGPGRAVRVKFAIPRSTPNTFLMEEFTSRAVVVRREADSSDGPVRVAVRFDQPLRLEIEV